MTFTVTVVLALGFLAVALFCGWRGAKPPDLLKGPRLVPWRPLMVGAVIGLLILVVHAINLLGVTTGR
jgi:hypothetical protein